MVSRDGAGKKKSKLVPFKQRGEPVVVSNIFISGKHGCCGYNVYTNFNAAYPPRIQL